MVVKRELCREHSSLAVFPAGWIHFAQGMLGSGHGGGKHTGHASGEMMG